MKGEARVFFLLFLVLTFAARGAARHGLTRAQVESIQAYDAARSRYATNPANIQAAVDFGRACFERADDASDDSERVAIANEGSDVCRQVVHEASNSAAAHYYLGLNLAEIARIKRLSALHLLREMEREWAAALDLQPSLDYAGPDRTLGLLFRDAPGPPLSLGSRSKAAQHLEHAVKIAPEYPENYLNLIESRIKWHQISGARADLQQWDRLLPAQRRQFSDGKWDDDWLDWNRRAARCRARLMGGSSR